MKIEYSIYSKNLENSSTYNSEFGELVVNWNIEKLNNIKILRYQFKQYHKIFEVNYNDILNEGLTLDEYFKNTIKLLYSQVIEYKQVEQFRKIVDKDEESKHLIQFFSKLLDDINTGQK